MALSTFADGRLWGERFGSGPPWALALHGWGRDHRDFAPVLDGLDAIALDLPGFGLSPGPPAAWSSDDYARDLVPVLGELWDGPLVVVGHSFGARVAVRLAALGAGPGLGPGLGAGAASRISALVLAGAPLAPPPGRAAPRPALAFRAGRALYRAGLVPERRMEALRNKYGSEDYREARGALRGVLVGAVAETAAGAYARPLAGWLATGGRTLELVWGERDEVASLEGARAALAGRSQVEAKVTVVPGAGHLITKDLAGQLRDALLRHAPSRLER
ncbi:MAG: alpha/beta fold hydrolase [Acidimicrobiales bacterium]